MTEQMFTEALVKIQKGLNAIAKLKPYCGVSDSWNEIENAVALNIGLLETMFEDEDKVITHFIFETNFGEIGRENPLEDFKGILWYFEHPLDVYDYFG